MRILILLISILLILSCAAQAPATGGPKDVYGPELISVSPSDASIQIEEDSKIIFEFDEMVDPTSVASSISIIDFDDIIIKSRRKKIIVEPRTRWPKNKIFEINLSRRIRDYNNNAMARGHQFIFTTGEEIPEGSIIGQLDNYNSKKITQLLLFSWPISDSSSVIKTVEANHDGEFEFLHLPSNKYTIFATESRLTEPLLATSRDRYGMIQTQYISIEGNQIKKIHIYMDEPIQRKKIFGVDQINPQFGSIKFSDGTEDEIIFSNHESCIIKDDSLTIIYDAKNRLEEYSIGPQSFLFQPKLDTIPPKLLSKNWGDEGFILQFSEPIHYLDSLDFRFQIDSTWNSIPFKIVDDRNIHLSINDENKVSFSGRHITDLYNNHFQDSLIEMNLTKKNIPLVETIAGGNIKGTIKYRFLNEIIIEAKNITSEKSTFLISTDGKFEFEDLEPGRYALNAFENKNKINSEIYFSGLWSPYNTAATYGIYGDTLDVRSRWDIEGVNFEIRNFLQE